MFEDSILESSPRWRTQRGWTTLASSTLQVAALALLVLVPVLRPDALPLRLRAAIAPLPADRAVEKLVRKPRPCSAWVFFFSHLGAAVLGR